MKKKVFERPEKKVFERSALVLVCLQGKLPGAFGALGETFRKNGACILLYIMYYILCIFAYIVHNI